MNAVITFIFKMKMKMKKIEVAQNCFSSHIQSVHAKQNVGFKSISTLLSFFIKMSLKCSQKNLMNDSKCVPLLPKKFKQKLLRLKCAITNVSSNIQMQPLIVVSFQKYFEIFVCFSIRV